LYLRQARQSPSLGKTLLFSGPIWLNSKEHPESRSQNSEVSTHRWFDLS
jgi:hypothetical protein